MQVTEKLFRPRCPRPRYTPSCSTRLRACRRQAVSDLQVLHGWQKQPEREKRTKISYRYLTPLLPRTVESYDALRHERDDLDEAWYFGKRDPLESEDEDDGVSQE